MSERTFDVPEVADILNQHFVAIKVDRDEHPDIDHIYMAATQLLTQHGAGGLIQYFACQPGSHFMVDSFPQMIIKGGLVL